MAIATGAAAAPMGPVKPSAGRFSIGLEGDVSARRMEWEGGSSVETDYGSAGIMGRVSYGFTERAEVWGRFGYASLILQDPTPPRTTVEFDNAFAWGVGGGGIAMDQENWNLAIQGNYNSHGDHALQGLSSGSFDATWSDWNIGVQAQGKYDAFMPYIGLRYSDATAEYSGIFVAALGGGFDDNAQTNFGIYGGFGYDFSPEFSAYLDGRVIDELGIGGGLKYSF